MVEEGVMRSSQISIISHRRDRCLPFRRIRSVVVMVRYCCLLLVIFTMLSTLTLFPLCCLLNIQALELMALSAPSQKRPLPTIPQDRKKVEPLLLIVGLTMAYRVVYFNLQYNAVQCGVALRGVAGARWRWAG